jgi:hypothetical protein
MHIALEGHLAQALDHIGRPCRWNDRTGGNLERCRLAQALEPRQNYERVRRDILMN